MRYPTSGIRILPSWRLRQVAVLLAAAFLLVYPPGAGAAKKFVIAFQGDAATLDGQGRNETTTISIQSHIYDYLIKVGMGRWG